MERVGLANPKITDLHISLFLRKRQPENALRVVKQKIKLY
nr:MAG TPA: hypothetical protein [Caudoviricetes sp.]